MNGTVDPAFVRGEGCSYGVIAFWQRLASNRNRLWGAKGSGGRKGRRAPGPRSSRWPGMRADSACHASAAALPAGPHKPPVHTALCVIQRQSRNWVGQEPCAWAWRASAAGLARPSADCGHPPGGGRTRAPPTRASPQPAPEPNAPFRCRHVQQPPGLAAGCLSARVQRAQLGPATSIESLAYQYRSSAASVTAALLYTHDCTADVGGAARHVHARWNACKLAGCDASADLQGRRTSGGRNALGCMLGDSSRRFVHGPNLRPLQTAGKKSRHCHRGWACRRKGCIGA